MTDQPSTSSAVSDVFEAELRSQAREVLISDYRWIMGDSAQLFGRAPREDAERWADGVIAKGDDYLMRVLDATAERTT